MTWLYNLWLMGTAGVFLWVAATPALMPRYRLIERDKDFDSNP